MDGTASDLHASDNAINKELLTRLIPVNFHGLSQRYPQLYLRSIRSSISKAAAFNNPPTHVLGLIVHHLLINTYSAANKMRSYVLDDTPIDVLCGI